jgi:hypothetical protein
MLIGVDYILKKKLECNLLKIKKYIYIIVN